jgi:predicted phosphodiesterase
VQAILSDVHGNLEALTAVLADLERQGADTVYNLGDTLGYGPNPVECLDLVQRMSLVLKGNFDQAVLFGPVDFCETARQSVLWTQTQLRTIRDPAACEHGPGFLAGLAASHRDGDTWYVHGSPRNPLNEYVFPEDIYNDSKLSRIGEKFDRCCFAGHTHIPGIFLQDDSGKWEFLYADQCEQGFPVAGCKILCNVGSVGQPRDDDERACYVLFDGKRIWFRRVAYDVEATIRKIYAVPELNNFLGDRLRDGR